MANKFDVAYGSTDMSIDTMTEGISKKGIQQLVEVMHAELLKGVASRLADVDGIATAIKSGWQGQSRDVFLENMTAAINSVINDLNSEYTDLLKRLSELVDSYFDQDNKMMEML